MKLQQIKYIFEVARNQLNVSATAEALYTSQPGISKQIRLLEDELGVEMFVRSGKHLTNITPAGREILPIADSILKQVQHIQNIAANHVDQNQGRLNLSASHTFSRYFLPNIVERYRKEYQNVTMHLYQDDTNNLNKELDESKLDMALVHEEKDLFTDKIRLPCFYWNRSIVIPQDHPLAKKKEVSFEQLAKYPLLTHTSSHGKVNYIEHVFKENGLSPDIVFSATDCEIIKSYVRMGLGVGIIANMAYEDDLDDDLVVLSIENLFPKSLVNLVFDRHFYFRTFIFKFIEFMAPHLSKDIILQTQQARSMNKITSILENVSIPTY
jgi:LysR family cys regulon transcriptional activator